MTILDQAHMPTGSAFHPAGSRRAWLAGRRAAERAAGASLTRQTLHAIARGVALFFGLFALLNLVGELRTPGFDQNIWWLDLRPLSASLSAAVLGAAGLLLVWWALRPAAPAWRRFLTAAAVAALAVVALKNGVTFYHVWADGLIRPRMGLPFSLVLAVVLAPLAWAVAAPAPASPRDQRRTRLRTAMIVTASLGFCGVLFPVAQQQFFGKTAYLRPAQVAVVLGAQVHSDGTPSPTLAARVRAAVQLYKQGQTAGLLMSGARGVEEPANETAVMRSLAIAQGVPASAISVDPAGFNTDATVRDTVPVLRANGYRSVAVVTDYFHLPRVKLAYQRAGLDVITVPSRGPEPPRIVVLREIPAFWAYYLRAVL